MKNETRAGHVAGLYLRAAALAQGDPRALQAFLQGQNSATAKTLIADTADSGWAADVATPAVAQDFLAAMTPYSALLQLPLRRVPARTRVMNASAAVGAAVVAEGDPTPIQVGAIDGVSLEVATKTIAEIVVTKELLQSADPVVERGFADDLAAAAAKAEDAQFLDDISSGQPSVASTGSSIAQIDADLKAAMALFAGDLRRAVWVMAPETAAALSLLRGSGGAPAHPGMGALGGRLVGLPAIVSEGAVQVGSPTDNDLFLIDPTRVAYADGGLQLERSEAAAIEVSATPSGGAQQLVTLWQNGLVALRATRWGSWHAVAGACVTIDGAAY